MSLRSKPEQILDLVPYSRKRSMDIGLDTDMGRHRGVSELSVNTSHIKSNLRLKRDILSKLEISKSKYENVKGVTYMLIYKFHFYILEMIIRDINIPDFFDQDLFIHSRLARIDFTVDIDTEKAEDLEDDELVWHEITCMNKVDQINEYVETYIGLKDNISIKLRILRKMKYVIKRSERGMKILRGRKNTLDHEYDQWTPKLSLFINLKNKFERLSGVITPTKDIYIYHSFREMEILVNSYMDSLADRQKKLLKKSAIEESYSIFDRNILYIQQKLKEMQK
jgi:hypothetical protein